MILFKTHLLISQLIFFQNFTALATYFPNASTVFQHASIHFKTHPLLKKSQFSQTHPNGKLQTIGNDADSDCKLCSGETCPTHHTKKLTIDNMLGNDVGECCDRPCSEATCATNYAEKQGIDNTLDNDADLCWFCSVGICPTHNTKKPGIDGPQGNAADLCCDRLCSEFTCPAHYAKNSTPITHRRMMQANVATDFALELSRVLPTASITH